MWEFPGVPPLLAYLLTPSWTQAFGTVGASLATQAGAVNSGTWWGPWRGGHLALFHSWPKLVPAPVKGSWPATCQRYFKNKLGKNERLKNNLGGCVSS